MNLLNERYYGNIAPVAKCFDQRGEYGEWVRTIAENEEALNNYLGDAAKQLLAKPLEAHDNVMVTNERERFIEGFRLGARLMLDTFLTPPEAILKDLC